MKDRTWVERALRVMLVVVMVLPFIGYFAPAASAHHPEIEGRAYCDEATGAAVLSWTATAWTTNDWFRRTTPDDSVRIDLLTGSTVEIDNGEFNSDNDYSFGGLHDASALMGQTVRVKATAEQGFYTNAALTTLTSVGENRTTGDIAVPVCPGSITVVKVTEGGVGTFGFSSSLLPSGFELTTSGEGVAGQSGTVFSGLVAGIYDVAEVVPLDEGWVLTSATCSDGSDPAAIGLGAGEDVTCTFVNTFEPPPEPGSASLTVVKVVDTAGAPAASFPFTMTDEAGFSLADAGSKSHTYVIDPAESTLAVSAAEGTLPVNWSFVSASCSNGEVPLPGAATGQVASVTLSDGDDVTCTFHNKYTPPHTPSGTIVIRKITQGSVGTFGFELVEYYEGDVSNAFDLTTVTQGVAVEKVFAGMSVLSWYSVSEDSPLPARWALTSASCVSDIEGQPDPEDFSLSDGETVTCTFINTYTPPREPELGSIGDFVWSDDNLNGLQDSGEPGISGVTVNLYDGIGTPLKSTTTDGTGHYLFSSLGAGTYVVEFVKPVGLAFTTANEAGPDPTDSDANVTTGRTGLITLGVGVDDMSWDAGIVPQVSPTTVVNTTTTAPPETLPFTGPTSTGVGGYGAALVLLGGLVLLAFRKKDDPVVESGFARRLDS